MREIIINKNEAGQRFDKLLFKYFNAAPASFVYKMLRKKNITLNNKKSDGKDKLAVGDCVKIFMTDETIDKFRSSKNIEASGKTTHKISLDVVYEDENVIIVNKPAGVLSQKAKKNDISMNEYIIEYLLDTKQLSENELETFKPGICNRLDRNTSGLLIAGKSLLGLQVMSDMLKDRTFGKYYITVVPGEINGKTKIKGYLTKDSKSNMVKIYDKPLKDSSYIETEYECLKTNGKYTILKVKLITGKPHQIRAHLASVKHPIIGDTKYGRADINEIFRKKCGVKYQLLHAWQLKFDEMPNEFKKIEHKTFEAKIPQLFENVFSEIGLNL
ncbi:RluA family pseudouridine synthase [Eubacterium sp.]